MSESDDRVEMDAIRRAAGNLHTAMLAVERYHLTLIKRAMLDLGLRNVRQYGLAPFAGLIASMPKSYYGVSYQNWLRRQGEITAQVKAKLEECGAVITVNRSDYRKGAIGVSLCGVTASSSVGLYRALRNWEEKALKQLGSTRRRAR